MKKQKFKTTQHKKDTGIKGLGGEDKAQWEQLSRKQSDMTAMELLADPERHKKLLAYTLDRYKLSEKAMEKFYSRWQTNEQKHQAYINLPDWEKVLKATNDKGKPPAVVNITVPYIFATASSIVTYMLHTFTGRKPIFTAGTYGDKDQEGARKMETVMQFNCDHMRMIKHMYQFFMDVQIYGVAIMRCQWRVDKADRTVWVTEVDKLQGFDTGESKRVRTRKETTVYEGNEVVAIDPFMFFPDPRVPMNECNTRGEFVFWKSFEGWHTLKKAQQAGKFSNVDKIGMSTSGDISNALGSVRDSRTNGTATPGMYIRGEEEGKTTTKAVELIQGTMDIIPAELGIGSEEYPVKYLITIGNRKQIIQCEPLALDHDRHPVVVAEPYGTGYGFGQLGLADYQAPIQDLLSWFMNSHMDNVKTALNNMAIVDPSKIEIRDLKEPGPGKIIRLKPAAYGTDVRAAYSQLPIVDVTSSHVKDFESLMRVGDALSSVTDNMRGLQSSGGRKTATEVRTSGEAGASRLAAQARIISAQAFVDLAEQMCLNIQQNQTEEFYLQIVGSDNKEHVKITPEMLVGDFHFPINDGTLPVDKVAMVDVWKEIFVALRSDPVLSQRYNIGKIFEYVAELGGARNIEQFKLDPQSPEAIQAGVAAGNMVPASEIGNISGGKVNAVEGNPAARIQQGGV